jgi:hypothetical protein
MAQFATNNAEVSSGLQPLGRCHITWLVQENCLFASLSFPDSIDKWGISQESWQMRNVLWQTGDISDLVTFNLDIHRFMDYTMDS